MAVTKFLARDLDIEIQVGGSGGNTFVAIKGLNSLAPVAIAALVS